MSGQRNNGIDSLRLVLMYMVCLLHVLGQGGVLLASSEGTVGYGVFWLIEALATCAVDGFAIISGYTAVNKPVQYARIVNMWFQVLFYSVVLSVLLSLAGVSLPWDFQSTAMRFFPVTFNLFWYFTAYFVLFFAMPLLNALLFRLDENASRKAFLLLFVLFCVIETIGAPFGAHNGYSFVWLAVLYCMGVLAKKIRLFEKKKSSTLFLIWLICGVLAWAVYVFGQSRSMIEYISPNMVIGSFALVVLFSRIPVKSRLVQRAAPLAFGIYLFQLNAGMWHVVLRDRFAFVTEMPLASGVVCVFAFSAALFAAGLAVEWLRSKLAQRLKIPQLSQKIVDWAQKCLEKPYAFLK